jgi:nitrogen-specific signal transduction histidine kinase
MSDGDGTQARGDAAIEASAPTFDLDDGEGAGGARRALSHALRNPLTPIRGYAELLLARLDAVAPAERALFARALETIFREARRLEAVLDTLDAEAPARAEAAGDRPDGEGE